MYVYICIYIIYIHIYLHRYTCANAISAVEQNGGDDRHIIPLRKRAYVSVHVLEKPAYVSIRVGMIGA